MLTPLPSPQNLIDRTYQQLLEAIADGTLPPGHRIRQAELAQTLGISRQPVSHALHLLKRQGLVEEAGRQGMRVVPLDPFRVMQLYQVREAIDGLAARLAAECSIAESDGVGALQDQLEIGKAFNAETPIPVLVQADAAFHRGLYRLSGNPAIEEMTAPLWPHLMRSMAMVLRQPDYAARVWQVEHAAILGHILNGDPASAEAAACSHASNAARRTADQLSSQAA
jgi:DNA-binding GntR family transcriptional regulator